MNSTFLVLIAVAVFVLGYRYYAKWLALWLLRLDSNYRPPAYVHADDYNFVACNPHLLLGQHFAILAGATTLIGSALAVVWGWIPAFLWVVVGTAVAGGTYAMGTLWLGVREAAFFAGAIGRRTYPPFVALASVLLTLLNALLVWLGAEVLAAHAQIAAPFWIQLAIALVAARYLRSADGAGLLALSFALTVATLATLWLLRGLPFSFSGALNVDIRGHSLVSIDAVLLWATLLLVSAYYAARAPVWRWLQPRAYLTAFHAALLLIVFFTGVLLSGAPLSAPSFNAPPGGPGVIPWLFVTVTSGAIAGVYLLFALEISSKQLAREDQVRYVGYGTAFAEGLLALSAIIVAAAGFNGVEQWQAFYTSWAAVQDPRALLELYISGCARFAAVLHLDPVFARGLSAFVIAGLIAVTLEAGVRVQAQLLKKLGERLYLLPLAHGRLALLLAIALVAVLAMHDTTARGVLRFWPLFGVWSQGLAVLGLALVALAMRTQGGRASYLLIPAMLLLALASAALALLLIEWWANARWGLFGGGLLLFGLEAWLTWQALGALRQAAVPRAEA